VHSPPIKIGIPKPDNWFDYVPPRVLVAAIPKDEWQNHINECVRICAPGGWVEFVESTAILFDGGPGAQQFNTWLVQGLATRGVDITMVDRLDVLMREAGLVNVTTQSYVIPFGDWGKQIGLIFAEDYRLLIESLEPLFIDVLCIPREQVEATLALTLEEFKHTRAHMMLYVHLGQKAVV
jgi:SAM-dependent methyltransferase